MFKVVIPGFNCEKWATKCLDSLFTQSYKNWEAIIVDDHSTDNTLAVAKQFIEKNSNLPNRIRLFERDKNVGALENIVFGIKEICNDPEDIIVLLDFDDWLADEGVLKHLTRVDIYGDPNIWLTHGQYKRASDGQVGLNAVVEDTQNYRKSEKWWRTSHLRTFKFKLWQHVKDRDLRDEKGNYYSMGWDLCMLYPMIEMAGTKRIKCIQRINYIYNDLNPISDCKKNEKLQLFYAEQIRKKPIYIEIP